jgi:peptidoglycan/xylan/chitin deacetylase (PgdA/CDA1 family)
MKKKMPVLLTFDVDGETLWLSRDPDNIHFPVTLSLGRYGPEQGVPRILRLLEKYNIKSTFFIPGFIVNKYPDMIADIDRAGHEIGNHGWSHTHPSAMADREAEKAEYMRSNELIEKLTGKRPAGYRSPAWEFSPNTLDIIEEMGFDYSSNMMNKDYVSYLKVEDRQTNLVELPIHWVLDDAAYWLYSAKLAGKCMQPLEAVEYYWKEEFEGLYEEFMVAEDSDICYILTCHPQIIGRPARTRVLENLIKYILEHPGVEFMTAGELASRFRTNSI